MIIYACKEEFKVIKDTISQSNKQLLDILDNVMKFTVNTDEKIDLPLTPKSVEALMTELYNMHTVIVPKEIQFNYVQGDSSDVVLTNRSSLLQIVSNLMNNAIKFTPEGSITLGWESNEDTITVFVQDTGIGIAHENLDKIFDKYFKQSSMMAGAGIGLSLCKRLTESMNGTISVESEVDKGSRFSVQLPRYSR